MNEKEFTIVTLAKLVLDDLRGSELQEYFPGGAQLLSLPELSDVPRSVDFNDIASHAMLFVDAKRTCGMAMWRWEGTHEHDMPEARATRRKVVIEGATFVDAIFTSDSVGAENGADNTITRRFFDWANLLRQIGVGPGRASAS
jgi:hypothetical protein